MDQNLDILIKIATEGGPQAEAALKKIQAAASAPLTNTGAGLASNPAQFAAQQQKKVELTLAEAEAVEKVAQRLTNLIAVRKASGLESAKEEAQLLQLNKAIEASPLAAHRDAVLAKTKAHQAATDEAKRQKTVLDELKAAQEDDIKVTGKSTEAKKSLMGAMRGLATQFPQLAELIRASTSALGLMAAAAAAAVSVVVARLREMAAERKAAADLRLEIEKLSDGFSSLDDLLAKQAGQTEAFVADYKKRTDAVAKLNKEMEREQGIRMVIGAQNAKVDDETLRGELLDIDESDDPESTKNLRRSQKIQEAGLRQERSRIDGIAKGSRTDFENASRQQKLEKELLGQAKSADPEIAEAEKNLEMATEQQKAAELFKAAQEKRSDDRLKLIRRGKMNPAGASIDGYLYTRKARNKWDWEKGSYGESEAFGLDDLEEEEIANRKGLKGITRQPDADFTSATKALEAARQRKQDALDAAKRAGEEGRRLEESGGTKRGLYEEEMRGFGDREPSIRNLNDRQNRLEYNKQWQREQEEKRKAKEREQNSPGTGGGSGGGGGFGGGGDFGALDGVTDSTSELTGTIGGFANEALALHRETASALKAVTTELSELRTYVQNNRIA